MVLLLNEGSFNFALIRWYYLSLDLVIRFLISLQRSSSFRRLLISIWCVKHWLYNLLFNFILFLISSGIQGGHCWWSLSVEIFYYWIYCFNVGVVIMQNQTLIRRRVKNFQKKLCKYYQEVEVLTERRMHFTVCYHVWLISKNQIYVRRQWWKNVNELGYCLFDKVLERR